MRISTPFIMVCAAGALVVAGASAQAQKPAAEEKTGIKVGEKAPDFKLTGADGKDYALSELIKKGKVALFFQRSADW